jgi:glycosyltransferase involved in cell wall biosynthesis
MNVLFFANYFYPHVGGVEKHVFELSQELIKNGHAVTVVTQQFDKKLPKFEKHKNIVVHRMLVGKLNWFQKFRIWRELFHNIDLIKNADIIHCHDVFFWYLPFRFLFFWKKVFVTFHGYESFPVSFKNVIVRKIAEILANGNICIGDFMKKWYSAKPTIVSYGGVTFPAASSSLQTSSSALFYGRLDDQTNILEYMQAVKLIRRQIPNFKFKIIGEGSYRRMVKNEIVEGFIKNPEKKLKSFRFAFLSRYLSILEALAARRLVFALYDNDIKEDYLRMSPFASCIVIAGSPEELCEKLVYYLSNPKKEKQLIDKGYKFAKENTWKKVCETYLALWRKKIAITMR